MVAPRWFRISLLGASLGVCSATKAAEPLELEWHAPPECPSGPSVRADVLQLAGAATGSSHRVVAVAHIQGGGEQKYQLTLTATLDGVAGEREFFGSSCDSVADAAVLTLALMLNPDASLETPSARADQPPHAPEPSEGQDTLRSSHGANTPAVTNPTIYTSAPARHCCTHRACSGQAGGSWCCRRGWWCSGDPDGVWRRFARRRR